MGGKLFIIMLIQFIKNMTSPWLPWPGASGGVLFNAVLVGAVLGDLPTGLQIGGTYELMNIGLNPLGGAVVPNYNLGSIVGTYFAITVSPEIGTAMGIVVATLATMLNTFSSYPAFFFKGLMEKSLKKHEFEKVILWETLNRIPPFIIGTVIPVYVICLAGEEVANSIISAVPKWLTNGFNVAGNALPALGFAIVLRSLNVNKNLEYLLIGFASYAFLKVGTVGAAIIGLALALIKFKQEKRFQQVEASGAVGGGLGDE